MKVSLNRAMAVTALALALFAAIRTFLPQFILGYLGMPHRYHAYAQTQTETQTQRIQLLQNDEVKVWRSLVLPNAPLAMHRHDHGRVIIPLQGGTMNIVDQSGAKEAHVWEAGKAYWLPANPPNTMHVDVNAGDKPIEVVVVELQKEK
jgi:heme/copper-type cytochrome/quinol oxidase subunit 1